MHRKVHPESSSSTVKKDTLKAQIKKQAASGELAHTLGREDWEEALLASQCASAVYGGRRQREESQDAHAYSSSETRVVRMLERSDIAFTDYEPMGVRSPHAKEDLAANYIPSFSGNKGFPASLLDLRHQLTASKVHLSELIINDSTTTQAWLLSYTPHNSTTRRMFMSFRGTVDLENVKSDIDGTLVPMHEMLPELLDGLRVFATSIINRTSSISFERVTHEFKDRLHYLAVHRGFALQYNSILATVRDQDRRAIEMGSDDEWKLCITGHSMGGALANICALDLLASGTVDRSNIRLVTIGGAPAGDFRFTSALDLLLHADSHPFRHLRYLNNHDPIPFLGIDEKWSGLCLLLCSSHRRHTSLKHSGTAVHFNQKGHLTRVPRKRHRKVVISDHWHDAYVRRIARHAKNSGCFVLFNEAAR